MKKFQRIRQQASEALGRGEKTDKLTSKLADAERKVEGIRNGCHVTTKKLIGTIIGSGSSMDKHQRKLPQYALGVSMMEAGSQLGQSSLFGPVLMMVGQAQQDIASQLAQYEITISHVIVTELNTMLEEDMKKIEKSKKKLSNVRLDMDSARTRLKSFESQVEKATREYNMEKLTTLKAEVDEATRKFEECQDTYATDMFDFLAKEQTYTDKIAQLVKLQITHYKNAAAQMESMLPSIEKRMNDTKERPMFGCPLEEHLRLFKTDVAIVLEACCQALRDQWMDTEGLFRIAAGTARVRLLKSAFDAGQKDLSGHDPHTIAGCLKMYLRELPEPILTYDLYKEWMQAAGVGDERERLQLLQKVVSKLPKANADNLKFLVAFLQEFSLYADLTKMSTNNIAIVIGPNLLWPREENADAASMVTETALQRRLCEALIDHCHDFFPDLPAAPSPSVTGGNKYSALTSPTYSSYSSGYPTSQSVTGSNKYSSPAPSLYSSSSQGYPPSSPRIAETSSAGSLEHLPHPLADHAADEGITVHMINEDTPSPTEKPHPIAILPPMPPNKPHPSARHSGGSSSPPMLPRHVGNPPSSSPVPKPRTGSSSSNNSFSSGPSSVVRTPSGDLPETAITENGQMENGPPSRPTPPVRPRRQVSNAPIGGSPAPPPKPAPYSPGTLERRMGAAGSGRTPQRKAPPPPVMSRQSKPHFNLPAPPPSAPNDDELTKL